MTNIGSKTKKTVPFSITLLKSTAKIQFVDRVYGSVPKDLDVLTAFSELDETGVLKNVLESESGESLEEKTDAIPLNPNPSVEEKKLDQITSCFRRHSVDLLEVLSLRDFMVKATIGMAGQVSGLTVAKRGVRPILRDGLQIRPQNIPFFRCNTDEYLTEPDGYETFVGHVTTMQGKRSIIRRCEYVENVYVEFDLVWVDKGLVTAAMLKDLLHFGGKFQGLSSQRRFEAGKFILTGFSDPEKLSVEEAFA